MAESEIVRDAVAGWIGGAVGIVVSNPLEVLKVRLQTNPSPNSQPNHLFKPLNLPGSPCPVYHSNNNYPLNLALQYSIPPNSNNSIQILACPSPANLSKRTTYSNPQTVNLGLRQLWKQEGYRFLLAGAAAPILGLAFIDSCFFATYGGCMTTFKQNREQPTSLGSVFASGAIAGGVCALLQTPIEVVKCQAQAEHMNRDTGSKSGSFAIAKKIYRNDGFRGFYLGGLMTGLRDSISSGIFFTCYTIIRKFLREINLNEASQNKIQLETHQISNLKTPSEIFQIMIAGGSSGIISALLPYPIDVIKTRLQVHKVLSSFQGSHSDPINFSPPKVSTKSLKLPKKSTPLIGQIIKNIHSEGKNEILPNLHNTRVYRHVYSLFSLSNASKNNMKQSAAFVQEELIRRRRAMKISLRIGGLRAFYKGLRPTLISSFVGSAITMGIFEFVSNLLDSSDTREGCLKSG
ncbi:mitochondrial carrier domain-containing protein [Phakopsora pachyrhizi]|uniref:Mitochondrial carrier domain-containing protein n=1 Tax=Phakopsora pachyrhizi TaxID=170000 RepID=A0AAV0BNB9_PHAPC|nr:mitochondrial carrier domain-containing protein [Phakopsora pachyrhizi]CAH7688215.1 mitochondrial carrier domain-containing protein [Phakopsora pachyrhizi]